MSYTLREGWEDGNFQDGTSTQCQYPGGTTNDYSRHL